MRALAYAILRLYCADCNGVIWFWQGRCGIRHTTCKHEGDLRIARRNGYDITWDCSYCGRPITEARP